MRSVPMGLIASLSRVALLLKSLEEPLGDSSGNRLKWNEKSMLWRQFWKCIQGREDESMNKKQKNWLHGFENWVDAR